MNIYVGNLAYSATEEELRQLFAAFGEVKGVSIIKDKFSGESRGFAFVEMPDNTQGNAAMADLNNKDYRGRALRINEARPRTENPPPRGNREGGGGGGGFRGGGGGDRGGRGDRGDRGGGGGRFDRGGGNY